VIPEGLRLQPPQGREDDLLPDRPPWLAGKIDKNDLLESPGIARLAASDAGTCYTQEVPLMLLAPTPPRKHSARDPFRAPLWDDQQPDFQRIDTLLPADHHARWLRSVVAHLDLGSFRRSYAGYGSLAYPVELLLALVLFMYSKGILCAAKWREAAKYDDQARWLLRGLQPSRAVLYRFRDRVEPFLDDWHAQILAWAIFEKITIAELDG
jgi:transposase